nr:DUF4440 domain-containing protein [Legionella pneumophila]
MEAMIVPDFWEVGASGQIYDKEIIIETLLERYRDPNYKDEWETSNFKCREIAKDNFLLTYDLVQGKERKTRRATLWRKSGDK